MILLDTSVILSALFADQNRHKECAVALLTAEPPLILSPFVLAEVDYLARKFAGVESELLFLADVGRRAYELAQFSEADVEEARQVVLKYRGLRIGLADASIVVLSRRYGTLDVLTLDERHFRAIRPSGRKSFRILPADRD
ncbi:MAG TPA: PIN domain-containing protein [Thermoanaerobaculia bacterium]|nr:PIN domain-containing protein [Thermoanaerobaculia bacterium]